MAYFDNLVDPDSPEVLSEEEFAKVLEDNDYYEHYSTCMKEYIDDFRTPRDEKLAILVEIPGKDLYFSVVVIFYVVSWETLLVYILTKDQYIDTVFANDVGAEALDKTVSLING